MRGVRKANKRDLALLGVERNNAERIRERDVLLAREPDLVQGAKTALLKETFDFLIRRFRIVRASEMERQIRVESISTMVLGGVGGKRSRDEDHHA